MLALKTFSKSDPDKRPSADVKGKFVPRVGESLSKSDQRIFWRKKLYLKRNIWTFSLVQSKVPICLGHVFADSLGLISYLTAKWKSILFPAIHVLGYTKGYSFRFYGWCLQIWLPHYTVNGGRCWSIWSQLSSRLAPAYASWPTKTNT